jgi:hypothetical protein
MWTSPRSQQKNGESFLKFLGRRWTVEGKELDWKERRNIKKA